MPTLRQRLGTMYAAVPVARMLCWKSSYSQCIPAYRVATQTGLCALRSHDLVYLGMYQWCNASYDAYNARHVIFLTLYRLAYTRGCA